MTIADALEYHGQNACASLTNLALPRVAYTRFVKGCSWTNLLTTKALQDTQFARIKES